jgi:hypothetical protein
MNLLPPQDIIYNIEHVSHQTIQLTMFAKDCNHKDQITQIISVQITMSSEEIAVCYKTI